MKIDNAKLVLTASQQAEDSVLMTGLHGIGKTEAVLDWAEENNVFLKVLYLSNQEVGDLIGIPYNREVNGIMVEDWSVPTWLQELKEASAKGKKTALFLDELARSAQDVRQAALQLVLDKKIHQHELPITNGQKSFIIAADNPDDGEYQVDVLDPALLDRFVSIDIDVDVESWLAWARRHNINKIVTSFIASNPNKLHFQPDEGSEHRVGSTPRAWAKLAAFVDNFNVTPREVHHPIIAGKIGKGIAIQFLNFYKNYNSIVSVEDVEELVNEMLPKLGKNKKLEKLGEAVKELLSEAEVIQKTELLSSLVNKYVQKKSEETYPMMAMLYSLEVEILVGFIKKFSSENNDGFLRIAEIDDELNNKALFIRLARDL